MRPCKAPSMCLPCRGTEAQPRGSEEEGDDKEAERAAAVHKAPRLYFLSFGSLTAATLTAGSRPAPLGARAWPGWLPPCLAVSTACPSRWCPACCPSPPSEPGSLLVNDVFVSSPVPSHLRIQGFGFTSSRVHIAASSPLLPSLPPPHSINAEPSTEAEGRPSPCPETLPPPPSVVCLTIKCPEEQTPAPRSALHPRAFLHPASPSFLHPGPFACTRARCHLQSRRSTCRPVMIIQSSVAARPSSRPPPGPSVTTAPPPHPPWTGQGGLRPRSANQHQQRQIPSGMHAYVLLLGHPAVAP